MAAIYTKYQVRCLPCYLTFKLKQKRPYKRYTIRPDNTQLLYHVGRPHDLRLYFRDKTSATSVTQLDYLKHQNGEQETELDYNYR